MTRLIPKCLGLGAVALTLCALGARAQDPSISAPNVRVVGSPVVEGNRVDAFGALTTVVTDQQILDLNAVDVAAALRRTPGVSISRFNPVGSFGGAEGGAVFIRGFGASRPGGEIKTYIDGIPFYMGVWNHPLLDLLPVNGISSIAVHKGPQPHVQGNNLAFVDITTRRAVDEGVGGSLRLQGGSFGTVVQQADVSVREGDLGVYLAQGFARSSGHRDNADGRLANVLGRVDYRVNAEWSLRLNFLVTDNEASDPGPVGQPALRNGQYETRGGLLGASLEHDHGIWKGTSTLYWSGGRGYWLNQAGTAGDTLTEWSTYGLRVRESITPWQDGLVLAGLDVDTIVGEVRFQPTNAPASRFDSPTFRLLSPNVAVSHRFRMGDIAIVPSAGLRYYDHSEFASRTAPHAGVSIELRALKLFANYARGINYPGLDVVVFSQNVLPPLGQSWRRLAAEEVDHFEIGARIQAAEATTVDVSIFEDRLSNRYAFIPPPPPPPQYVNQGGFTIRGMEAAVQHAFSRDLSTFLGVTLLDRDPDTIPYAPDLSASAGVIYQAGPWRLSADVQYVSEFYVLSRARTTTATNTERVGGFPLLNARVAHALPPQWVRRGEVFVAVENVADRMYAFRPGYPMPGIAAYVGAIVGF
jgi:iron complex outermembrane receptor protein